VARAAALAALAAVSSACAAGARAPARGPEARPTAGTEPALPPIPVRAGAVELDLVYPPEGGAVTARDSTFVFGSTGAGGATLTINGIPVRVEPNGSFLAFLPVPPDGVYRLDGRAGGRTARLERAIEIPAPPDSVEGAAIIAGSLEPAGAWAVQAGERVDVAFRGAAGAAAWLVLPTGERLPMIEARPDAAGSGAAANFQRTMPAARPAPRVAAYRRAVVVSEPWLAASAELPVPVLGELAVAPGTAAASVSAAATVPPAVPDSVAGPHARVAVIELVLGADTVRAPVPANIAVLDLALPRVGVVRAPADAPSDWTARGRHDVSGPFHYFWPAGTRLEITGQRGSMLRVRLSDDRVAWVPVGDIELLTAGTPPPASAVGAVRLAPADAWIDVRIALDERLPFHVEQDGTRLHIDVFGATSRVNFFQYGALDPLVHYAEWSQPSANVFRVTVDLARPVWGYAAFHDAAGALVLRIRRPPQIDPSRPLAGLLIAIDAGHPPGGAIGPTRLSEAEANLAIARRLAPMLEAAGARVLMTRTDEQAVDLGARPRMAADSGAHLLVSIHNNAFPDGVNPFENAGTSVYYYQPHSAPLARVLQRELLDELRLRDIGIGRADLALVRPTWMPAALTETMFLMVPRQEAALRDPSVHERIARAHVRALETFIRENASR